MNKRGEVLIENVVFILLNLIFLSILVAFLMKQGSGAIIMEESYAKQIALVIDSGHPGEIVKINMKEALGIANDNGFAFERAVVLNDSMVTVKLSSKGGYSYHYFNDVKAAAFPIKEEGSYSGVYAITISGK